MQFNYVVIIDDEAVAGFNVSDEAAAYIVNYCYELLFDLKIMAHGDQVSGLDFLKVLFYRFDLINVLNEIRNVGDLMKFESLIKDAIIYY